jgi:phosphatidylglycerol:prolipoprotein diacylglycerol transferase
MFPILHLGNLEIPMYSTMIAFGISLGLFLAYYFFYKKEQLSVLTGLRLLFCACVGLIFMGIGAYFFNSLFHSIEEGQLIFGGITYLGGVVVGYPVTIIMIHKLIPSLRGRAIYTFSLIVPYAILAHGFGRIGCFCAGCCYGIESNSIFAVKFPLLENKVLPTQLFEAIFEFLLFAVIMIFRKKTKGKELTIYCFAYGIFRFFIEFLRGDSRGSTGIGISPAQLLDIFLIVCGVLLILFEKGKVFKKLYQKCLYWQNETKNIPNRSFFFFVQTPEEKLKELSDLRNKKIITEEEFNEKKQKIMKRI